MLELNKEHIRNKFAIVREKIARAAREAGRSGDDVALVAVTKLKSVVTVRNAIAAGIRVFGENRIQEALPKIETIRSEYPDVIWHMVGHLQSNKARKAVENFQMIQSIDSVKLARRVSRLAGEQQQTMDVLVEVNVSGEKTKYGFTPEHVPEAIGRLSELGHINIRGLMTVGPMTDDDQRIQQAFKQMKSLYDEARSQYREELGGFNILSMGMTDDFEIAIREGSTMVRIGRALFGARK